MAKGESAIKVLESVGKFDMVQEHKENLDKIRHVKECLIQLVYMDIDKPAQKMKDQAKLLGYFSRTILISLRIALNSPTKRLSEIC